jgi:hypothetical protein
MCRPVWHNIKRTTLAQAARTKVGQQIRVCDPNFNVSTRESMLLLEKLVSPTGTLMYVRSIFNWGAGAHVVIHALWYPTYGGGGWLDLPKDPMATIDVAMWKAVEELAQAQAEQNALNCMAL